MKILKEFKWNMILAALIYIALGVVLLVWPDFTSRAICTVLGGLLLVYGLFQVIGFFAKGSDGWSWAVVDLLVGLCALGLGVFALLSPEAVLSVLPIALGAVVIVDSCVSLKRALQLRELGMEKWWVVCVLAIITALFGLLVVFNPFATLTVLVRVIGAVLIYEGISDIVTVRHVAVYVARAKEALEAVEGTVKEEKDVP